MHFGFYESPQTCFRKHYRIACYLSLYEQRKLNNTFDYILFTLCHGQGEKRIYVWEKLFNVSGGKIMI